MSKEFKDISPEKTAVIILAAGISDRMGMPKFKLKYDNGHTFLEKIIKEYEAFGCGQIILVLNDEGYKILKEDKLIASDKIKIVINSHPEFERFYSIKIGLNELQPLVPTFIQNSDNPFITQDILKKLIKPESQTSCFETNDNYYVPVFKGSGGHPVLFSSGIVQKIKMIKEPDLNLRDVLQKFTRINIDVEDQKVLININTLEEYRKLF